MEYLVPAITITVFVILCAFIKIWWEERSKVKRTPKVPFTVCDKHGPYPSEYSFKIVVPAEGKPDLIQELCPMCYKERMDAAKVK